MVAGCLGGRIGGRERGSGAGKEAVVAGPPRPGTATHKYMAVLADMYLTTSNRLVTLTAKAKAYVDPSCSPCTDKDLISLPDIHSSEKRQVRKRLHKTEGERGGCQDPKFREGREEAQWLMRRKDTAPLQWLRSQSRSRQPLPPRGHLWQS